MRRFILSLAIFTLASPLASAGFDFSVTSNAIHTSSVSFDGTSTGALVGFDLAVDRIFNPSNPKTSVTLQDGTLNFRTGAYKGLATVTNADGSTSQAWDFAAGGSFIIRGDLPGQNSPLNLFTGKFANDTYVFQVLGGFNIINSPISGFLNKDIAAVFGQAGGRATGGFADLFQANALPGQAISHGMEYSGNLGLETSSSLNPVPEPASLLSITIGLLGVSCYTTYRNRRKSV